MKGLIFYVIMDDPEAFRRAADVDQDAAQPHEDPRHGTRAERLRGHGQGLREERQGIVHSRVAGLFWGSS